MGIKFITDSAADLPAEVVEDYNIDVFPLYVSHKEQYFKDREEIKPKTLYDGMREGKVYKTSQVTVNDFAGKFRQYAEADKTVIYFAFSSELSGTMQSAVLAKNQVLKDYPDFDLTIIDTRSASLGIGLALLRTLQAVEKGDSKEEVIEKAGYFTGHMHHIFTVDDLEYLVRGGRLGKVAGFVGTIMNIKPILAIEDGKLVPLEKKKGRKNVLKRIIEIMEEKGTDLAQQTIGISHGDDQKGVEQLQEMITSRFGCDSFLVNTVGAVIGAHSGPGTLAVFFINDHEKVNDIKLV